MILLLWQFCFQVKINRTHNPADPVKIGVFFNALRVRHCHAPNCPYYLDSRFGIEAKSMQKDFEQITDLDLLHHLLRDLYRAENRKEMSKLIEQAKRNNLD